MSIIFQKKNIQVNKPFDLVFLFLICSMLLRRECCTFSNGEYVKSGLCVLEKWIVDTEEVRSRPFSHLYLDQHSTVCLFFSML
jgi:hypothetical protein